MKRTILLLATILLFSQCNSDENETPDINNEMVKETITFTSNEDDLTITADTYIDADNSKFILLCHQSGYSRGEYLDVAPKFAEKGYNCMAIDQRSGGAVNGVINETASAASLLGLLQTYTSAIPDVDAAINKAYELNGNNPIYILGSSYSSSIALIQGKSNPKVKGVIAFSPRENLQGINITNTLSGYAKPMFVTSAQSETATTAALVVNVSDQYLTHYQSTEAGIHGSRCLWESTTGYQGYWASLEQFLAEND